jgi:glycosyltransferase involved in cell wall biosynthesis
MLQVSVIIPTYNRAQYLPQALQSVFEQSLIPFEVIVVDDGSTDCTADLMNAFESRVHYCWHRHNKGVAAARNSGLAAVHGDVVAWLDADDLWEPDFLATVIPLLEADEGLDGIYTGLVRIDADGNLLPHSSQMVVPPSNLYSALVEDCFIQTSTFVARKRCFASAGGFDTRFRICEDYDMFLRLAKVFTIAGVPAPLVRYRVHGDNTVANADAFCRFRLAVTRKHFGEPEGDPRVWPPLRRRAHGCAFRAAAFKCIQSGQTDRGWDYLEKAVSIWPALLGRLDTLYELACGDQPMGYRGHTGSLDIEGNGREMFIRLDALFAKGGMTLEPMRRSAYGNAYLALGMLNDQAGHWGTARRNLFRAVQNVPRLLASPPVLRRLLKLCAGKGVVGLARSVLGSR